MPHNPQAADVSEKCDIEDLIGQNPATVPLKRRGRGTSRFFVPEEATTAQHVGLPCTTRLSLGLPGAKQGAKRGVSESRVPILQFTALGTCD